MSMSKGPYENHYYHLGDVIRGTVREAQDTLCRVNLGRERQNYWFGGTHGEFDRWLMDNHASWPGTSYPQSLGELCIELAQNSLVYTDVTAIPDGWVKTTYFRRGLQRDIQELREKMWHKHTDRGKEIK